MKKILIITGVLGLLGILASCSKDFRDSGVPGENAILVELFCADPATKGMVDPVAGTGNENLVNQIQYFFFADENSTPIYGSTFTPASSSKTADTQLISIAAGEGDVPVMKTLFPNSKAIFYAVANYTGDLSGKTLKEIKQLAIEKTYGTETEMTGTTANKYFVMTAEQEIRPQDKKASIPLKRIAAKVSLTVSMESVETTDEDGVVTTWTPIWEVARGTLEREATKGLLGAGAAYTEGEGDAAQTKYYLPTNLGLTTPNDQQGEFTKFPETAKTQSFYTMPNRWEAGAVDEPDLKIIVRWNMESKKNGNTVYKGISDERYYKIMLPGSLTSFDANCWYKLTAAVSVNASEMEPLIALEGFTVQGWNSPGDVVSADVKDVKYITPERSNVEFIGNSYTLSYSATGPVEVSNLSVYRVRYTSSGEGKLELITNNTPNNTNIGSLKDYQGNTLTEAKVRAWESLDDATKTITIDHTLCNDFTKDWFDAVPYVYVITLHLTDQNTSYDKTVTIRQIPNFTLKQIQSNGFVFVNNSDNRNGTENFNGVRGKYVYANNNFYYYNYGWGWPSNYLRRGIGGLVNYNQALQDENNNCGYMYLVSAAVSSDFSVLDPRSTSSDDLINTALGVNVYKSTRNIDAVAPLFIIASSYGKTLSIPYDAAKARCAAYQEAGYPAGRWRVPTEKEINFLITLRKNNFIPELFYSSQNAGDQAGYWASSGNYYYYKGGEFRSGTDRIEAVRCIYDAWYWGEEPLDNNGKKTTNTNAATNWLTYEFANKISN